MSPFDVFRKAIPLKRVSPGAYDDNGVWIEGAVTTIQIRASVQPTTAEDVATVPENRRAGAEYKLYSDFAFRGVLEDTHNPDKVTLFGQEYEVTKVAPWDNGIVPHYKAILTRVQP
jgi:hypothetical protein